MSSIGSFVRRATGVAAFGSVIVAITAQGCGGLPSVPGVPTTGGKCPDMANVDALADVDWAQAFPGIDAKLAADLKVAIPAAVELKQFAMGIDGDLKTGCGGLATDLGATGEFKNGKEACEAAVKAMGDFKGKLGAKASAAIDIEPPKCGASLDVQANCLAKCDASFKPGEAKLECEPGKLQGECSAQCEGSCEASGGIKCDGTCAGKCDAQIKGKCGGVCDGKCDGKPGKAACAGVCEGKCDADVQAECKGTCSGSCQMKAKAECKGTCTGSCSAEMKAPKCTGQVKPPQASAECNARCEARATAKLECTPARVVARVAGDADAKLVGQFKGAIEKNVPVIAKVSFGMAEKAPKIAGSVEGIIKGVKGSVEASVSGSTGDLQKAAMMGSLSACVLDPLKGALEAAGNVTGSVQASVSVNASLKADK